MNMVTIYMDSLEWKVPSYVRTLAQASVFVGTPLPGRCYYNGLLTQYCIGMCAVYCMQSKKVVFACQTFVKEGTRFQSSHNKVADVRRRVVDLLLAKHPLECPVCVRNGTCELQDYVMEYASDACSKAMPPRDYKEQYFGGFLKTKMSRCVLCGLCSQFSKDVVGSDMIVHAHTNDGVGVVGLGSLDTPSIFSGNLVDVCPVGAIMGKDSLLGVNKQEIIEKKAFDLHDSLGTPILYSVFDKKIVSVKPQTIKGHYKWISDKVRFGYDGFFRNRIIKPTICVKQQRTVSSWKKKAQYLCDILERASGDRTAIFLGPFVDLETMWVLKTFRESFGIKNISMHARKVPDAFAQDAKGYTFGGLYERLYESDAVVLVGLRPVEEAPLLHTMLVKHHQKTKVPIFAMADPFFMPYGHNVGPRSVHVKQMMSKEGVIHEALKNARRPLFICGFDALSSRYCDDVYGAIRTLANDYTKDKEWNGYAFVAPYISFVGGCDLGLFSSQTEELTGYGMMQSLQAGYLKAVFLLGYDHIPLDLKSKVFMVYQGTHNTAIARAAHVSLPVWSHIEKRGSYVNAQGHFFCAPQVLKPNENTQDVILFMQEMMRCVKHNYYAKEREDIAKEVQSFYEKTYGIYGEKRLLHKSVKWSRAVPTEVWSSLQKNYYHSDHIVQASANIQNGAKGMDWSQKQEGVW